MTKLSTQSRATLLQPRFSVKAPSSFKFPNDYWIDNVPILGQETDGKIKIAYPSYHTRPTLPTDEGAQSALDELNTCLDAVARDIYIAPGEWVVWDNSVIVHRRGAIGDGKRLLFRTYIRRDCNAMREATGSQGPIFSARQLLDAGTTHNEGESNAG